MDQRLKELEDWNVGYEAEKRAFKNQQEMLDNQTMHAIRQQLMNVTLFALPEAPYVPATMPINRLPHRARGFVDACSRSIVTHLEIFVVCLFAAMFTAARGSFRIQVNEHHVEVLTEYFLVSAPSGQKKSSALDVFRSVFADIETEQQACYNNDGKRVQHKILQSALKKSETGLAKKLLRMTEKLGSLEAANAIMVDEFLAHQQLLKEFQKSSNLPRILADTATLEALPFEMKAQNEALAILEAEGSTLRQIRGRNNDVVLKAFTGESFLSDTKTLGSVSMDSPVLSVCILTQPNIAKEVYDDVGAVERGLASRFLPFLAPSRISAYHSGSTPVPNEMIGWYRRHVRALLEIARPACRDEERTFHTLTIAADAKAELERFSNYCQTLEQKTQGVESGGYRAFLNKLPGHALRLAGAVHMMKFSDPHKHQIDRDSMESGAEFADFFRAHAIVAFDATARDGIVLANKVLDWLTRQPRSNFSLRDAHRGVGSSKHKSDQVEAGTRILHDSGYIRGVTLSSGQVRYVVNPNFM